MGREEQLQEAQQHLEKLQEKYLLEQLRLDRFLENYVGNIPKDELRKFADAEITIGHHQYVSGEDGENAIKFVKDFSSKYSITDLDELIDAAQQAGVLLYDIEEQQEIVQSLKTKKQIKKEQVEKELAEQNIDTKGHLFPIKMVYSWTKELERYDQWLDEQIEELKNLEVDIDVTLLCKWAERACRRVNYLLALLRHKIVKALSGLWVEILVAQTILKTITSAKPTDLGGSINWINTVISLFMGPYKKIIQFIMDFQTYVPPLVSKAVGMVEKVTALPVQLMNCINLVATDADGNVRPVAELYKEYLQIDFKPITLDEIMFGTSESTPTYMGCLVDKKQNEVLKSEVEQARDNVENILNTFIQEIKQLPDNKSNLWVAWPGVAFLLQDKYYATSMDFDTTDPETDCLCQATVCVKCFGKQAGIITSSVDLPTGPLLPDTGGGLLTPDNNDSLLGGSSTTELTTPSEEIDYTFNKHYTDKKVNTLLHKYYPVYNFKDFITRDDNVEIIKNSIAQYHIDHFKTINWGTGKKLKNKKLDEFDVAVKNIFLKYSEDIPQINPMLSNLEDACKKYVEAKEKQLADAKVSAFK